MSMTKNRDKAEERYWIAYEKGKEAVRAKPSYAPRNPFNEDEDSNSFNGWEQGAISAGLCEIYTNGELNEL